MQRQIKGYILIIVLMYLQLCSVLGIYGLTHEHHILKIEKNHFTAQSLKKMAEDILHEVEQFDSISCLVPTFSLTTLMNQPRTWWQENGCYGKLENTKYYYVIESLDMDRCAVIKKIDDTKIMVADYFRLSLLVVPENLSAANLLTQITFVKAKETKKLCPDNLIHFVSIGRQSWRSHLF